MNDTSNLVASILLEALELWLWTILGLLLALGPNGRNRALGTLVECV